MSGKEGVRKVRRGAVLALVQGVELAGINDIVQQVDTVYRSTISSLTILREHGVFKKEKASRPWPLNVALIEPKTSGDGDISFQWMQGEHLMRLALWPTEYGSSLSWQSEPTKPEGQFSEEDVRGMGMLIYARGQIIERKYEPRVLTANDLPSLREIAETERQWFESKPDRPTGCGKKLEHLLLLIGEIEDSDSHSVVEAVSQRTEKPAVLAEIEITRAWQDMKRIEASLVQAVADLSLQSQEVLGEGK